MPVSENMRPLGVGTGVSCLAARPSRKRNHGRRRWHSSAEDWLGAYDSQPGENAMSTVWQFVAKFASLLVCTAALLRSRPLQGPSATLAAACELERFVDYACSAFDESLHQDLLAPQWSDFLVQHAQQARGQGLDAPISTAPVSFKKDQWSRRAPSRATHRRRTGRRPSAPSKPATRFVLVPAPEQPRFVSKPRLQRVLY